MITGAIQDIVIHIIPIVTKDLTSMVIHIGMGLCIDTHIIIDTGIITVDIMAVNLWNLVLVTR